jgi:hypothetical protein
MRIEVLSDAGAVANKAAEIAQARVWRKNAVDHAACHRNSERDFQRGVFAQLLFGRATLGFYVFNPDDSAERLAVVTLGAVF